jgi:hypothetical protein
MRIEKLNWAAEFMSDCDMYGYRVVLWYVDPLLGNGNEMSNYTTAVTRQQPVNDDIGIMFSVQSVPKCYKQDKLGVRSELVGELVS